METSISFVVAAILVIILGYFVAYYRNKCNTREVLVEAFKEIIRARYYEQFRHIESADKKHELMLKLDILRDSKILRDFEHPQEFLIALDYYVKIMKHDMALDIATLKADELFKNMDA